MMYKMLETPVEVKMRKVGCNSLIEMKTKLSYQQDQQFLSWLKALEE